MTAAVKSIDERLDRLHKGGIIDLHFDLPMDLYEKRDRKNVLESEFLPEFDKGNIGVLAVAVYIEDRYLPETCLRVALDQIARLYAEIQTCKRLASCKSFREMQKARETGRIALLITMGAVGWSSVMVTSSCYVRSVDRYIGHIVPIANLIGSDGVGIGFDFFEFIYCQWPESRQKALATKFTTPHFIPDLRNHSHARNLTRRLIERGFSDEQIEKILRENWMRIFKEVL